MKVLFDSSTLIAASVQNHPKYKIAFSWLEKVENAEVEGFVSAHTLLEVFSVLTRAPFQPKILPEDAIKLIHTNILSLMEVIPLDKSEYLDLLELLANHQLKGGIVYDALILKCCLKKHISNIITANRKDFEKLVLTLNAKIKVIGI